MLMIWLRMLLVTLAKSMTIQLDILKLQKVILDSQNTCAKDVKKYDMTWCLLWDNYQDINQIWVINYECQCAGYRQHLVLLCF